MMIHPAGGRLGLLRWDGREAGGVPSRVNLVMPSAAVNGHTSANFACFFQHFYSSFVNRVLKVQFSTKHPGIDLFHGFTAIFNSTF